MPATAKTIDFYLDFTSPYAYLASTQVDALAQRQGVNFIWRPFLVGASFKITGRKAPVEHPLVREYMLHDVQRYARLLGQPIAFPKIFPILSVKPARLFYYLQQRDTGQQAAIAFARAVFHAYFVEQLDITDNAVLARLLLPYGVAAEDLNEITRSADIKQMFKDEVAAALEKQIFGVPTFIVDGEMFWGLDRMPQLEQWLTRGGW